MKRCSTLALLLLLPSILLADKRTNPPTIQDTSPLAVTRGEGYAQLLPFLDRHDPGAVAPHRPRAGAPFPHVDVFHLSAFRQPWWMQRYWSNGMQMA